MSSLLRKYTVGDGGVYFEVLNSDDRRVFPAGQVTHEDPHLNIETPVFIVHGNHGMHGWMDVCVCVWMDGLDGVQTDRQTDR